jgi:hypothetical protein
MQMSKPGICCAKCFRLIASKSTNAARLWLDICDLQIKAELLSTDVENTPLRILETFGFITTTDTIDKVLIKVHGKQYDDLGVYFCGGKCDE